MPMGGSAIPQMGGQPPMPPSAIPPMGAGPMAPGGPVQNGTPLMNPANPQMPPAGNVTSLPTL